MHTSRYQTLPNQTYKNILLKSITNENSLLLIYRCYKLNVNFLLRLSLTDWNFCFEVYYISFECDVILMYFIYRLRSAHQDFAIVFSDSTIGKLQKLHKNI